MRDYFSDRKVVFSHDDEQWTFGAERGVPQGSCSGLFLWNVVLDTALDVGLPEGCFLQTFADGLVLVVRGLSKEDLAAKGTMALQNLTAWGALHKLTFNPSKTIRLPITYGGRLSLNDPPLITMNSTVLQASGGCRYLGVWWDSGLTFSEHFKRVRRRVDVLSYRLSMVAGRFFTRRAKLFFRIYKGALEPYILYGYGAWGNRLSLKKVRDLLNSIQRRPLVKITRAYRTTSTTALQVISGVLPLDLKAQQVFAKFQLFILRQNSRVGSLIFRSQDYQCNQNRYDHHPLAWRPVPFSRKEPLGFDLEIFTDGSKLNGQVGSSAVVFYHGKEIQHSVCRLPNHASVFAAEITGMDMTLSIVQSLTVWDPVRIYTDSLSLLQALPSTITVDPMVWTLKEKCIELMAKRNLQLFWVKAHVGVTRNEAADQYAKGATTRSSADIRILKTVSDFRREVKSELISMWQTRWVQAATGRQTARYFPLVDFVPKL
ncbi:Putative protein in type-1 retrotransposable element R1DM [Araneus ventricosus]|uniref:RNase H type-1 domain-containing protein n=1 Tax=Araneus ventricosus TaxID=182803 RepID=A0A4Y2JWB8_ARAVE|nr:Putative protein in type-1 retrotransposable element R1DM [Araneus ventricosus]